MGTATAASPWATGALRVAVAYGLHDIAVIPSAFAYVTLRYLILLKDAAREADPKEDRWDAP